MNEALFRAINGLPGQWPLLDVVMMWLAQDATYALLVIALASWLVNRLLGRPIAVRVALGAIIAVAICETISMRYFQPRPFVSLPNVLQLIPHAEDSTFPSTHATALSAITGPYVWNRARLGILLLVGTLLVGFARIYVGVHYPVDILAGFALGFGVSYFLARVATPFDGIERWVLQRLPAWL